MSDDFKTQIIEKYGKYIVYALFAFGAPALTTYVKFVMMEHDIENLKHELLREVQIIDTRLEKKIKMIKEQDERIRVLECSPN